jgi:hypothetical protein
MQVEGAEGGEGVKTSTQSHHAYNTHTTHTHSHTHAPVADMQGVTPKSKGARRTPNPVFGHFYRRDFVQYKVRAIYVCKCVRMYVNVSVCLRICVY